MAKPNQPWPGAPGANPLTSVQFRQNFRRGARQDLAAEHDVGLSRLPEGGFSFVIVEPGMNVVTYPSHVTDPRGSQKNVKIIREPIYIGRNEIVYFRIKVTGWISPSVSGEFAREIEAVDSLEGKSRVRMQMIGQE